MESTPKSLLDGLRFDIFEHVQLSESDKDIELIEETELTPQIKVLMHKGTIQLVGKLLLKLKYLDGLHPWIDNNFEFSIPVEINIPAARVSDAWLLDADIENFSIEQVGNRSLNVTGVLKVYEKKPVKVESQSQERLSEDDIQRFERFYAGEIKWAADPDDVKILLTEVKRLQAIEAERDRYKAALEQINKYPRGEALVYVGEIKEIATQAIKGAVNHE